MAKRLSQAEIDRFAAASSPAVTELIAAVRAFILEEVPDADESLKWNQPWYERGGPFAYIGSFTSHVNLGFPRGSELTDRFPLLQGSGKGMRHVKIRSADDLRQPIVAELIRAAAQLNE